MLITEEVEVRLNKSNTEHFELLGYEIPRIINKDGKLIVSSKTTIKVKVSDLQPTSRVQVMVQCDYDDKIFPKDYYNYLHQRRNIEKDCCNNVECMKKKRAESNLKIHGVENSLDIEGVKDKIKQTNYEKFGNEYAIGSQEVKNKIKQSFNDKYGVDNPFQIEDVKNKIIQTNLDKYGVEYYTQTDEYKERHKQTSLEKYGYDNVSKVPEFISKIKDTQIDRYGSLYVETEEYKERCKQTCQERYGVDNVFQLDRVKQRIIEYNIETYGVDHPMKVEEIKQDRIKKMTETKYKNGTMQSSRQQEYLCNLYSGLLNYPVQGLCLDIALLKEMIFIEYDGSGHSLSVQFGDITQENFNKKEIRRKYFLKSLGWKEIRIISLKDFLPLDDILLHMYNISLEYLNSSHSWIKFDIDSNKIICSQFENDFDYGILRKITDKDLKIS